MHCAGRRCCVGVRIGINEEELEEFTSHHAVVEEFQGYSSTLVQDGSRTGDVSVNHLIQLLGSHSGKELQSSPESRLMDGETHQSVSRVISSAVSHWIIGRCGSSLGGKHFEGGVLNIW
jgi:hypothetical protein